MAARFGFRRLHPFDDLVQAARISARALSARNRWFADLVDES